MKDALQPVLKLLLGPDGESLRVLAVKEAIRVTEAFVLGTVNDTYNSIPDFMRLVLFRDSSSRTLGMSNEEQESMIELRDQVLRIWRLLQSSENFDPALLQPIVQVRISIFFCLCFSTKATC